MSELHLPQGEARFVSWAHPPARGGEVRGLILPQGEERFVSCTSRKGRRGSWAHPPRGGEVRGLILQGEERFVTARKGRVTASHCWDTTYHSVFCTEKLCIGAGARDGVRPRSPVSDLNPESRNTPEKMAACGRPAAHRGAQRWGERRRARLV